MSTTVALPHWDMTVVYPGLESPEFQTDFQRTIADLADLAVLFDRHGIERHADVQVDSSTVEAFDTVVNQFAVFVERLYTLHAYIYCFVSTDSRNTVAQARLSELRQHMVRLSQLDTRLTAWIGSMDVEALIRDSSVAREYEFMVRRARIEAQHLMSPAEEALAAELRVSGGSAWSKLHGDVTSQLLVRLSVDGEQQEVPMSVVRNMAYDADRETRKRGYEAELATWKTVAVALAAALNSIKGETNTLAARRHWESPLDAAVFANHIDRATLDAMFTAARASFPDFRRYLRAKARALGLPALAWYDLFAPVGKSTRTWEYGEATDFLVQRFGTYSPTLREFAQRALRESWIDAEPRPGKRDGAFCLRLRKDESRVLANYKPTYDGMSTLAHELGHGYHNYNLASRPILQQDTPSTLAETASTFCETIVREAALQHADEQEQLAILEAALSNACQIVVDITSRFIFEQAVFERRRERELSVDELNELMLDSQRQTYGDGLDQSTLHEYMWAVKTHYYNWSFYNFPYMFGLLFGLGLYAQYRNDPDTFRTGYDELLASTGQADAAALAARFGIDIRTPDFWRASLDIIRGDIDRFEHLISAGVS